VISRGVRRIPEALDIPSPGSRVGACPPFAAAPGVARQQNLPLAHYFCAGISDGLLSELSKLTSDVAGWHGGPEAISAGIADFLVTVPVAGCVARVKTCRQCYLQCSGRAGVDACRIAEPKNNCLSYFSLMLYPKLTTSCQRISPVSLLIPLNLPNQSRHEPLHILPRALSRARGQRDLMMPISFNNPILARVSRARVQSFE